MHLIFLLSTSRVFCTTGGRQLRIATSLSIDSVFDNTERSPSSISITTQSYSYDCQASMNRPTTSD